MKRFPLFCLLILIGIFISCNNAEESLENQEIENFFPEYFMSASEVIYTNTFGDTLVFDTELIPLENGFIWNLTNSDTVRVSVLGSESLSESGETNYFSNVIYNTSVVEFPQIFGESFGMVIDLNDDTVSSPESHLISESLILNEIEFTDVYSIYDTTTLGNLQVELHYSEEQGVLGFRDKNVLWTYDSYR
jgi:hypothetical protein